LNKHREKKMNETAVALIGYIGWFMVLLLLLATVRVMAVVTDQRAPNSFRPDGTDMTPFVARLVRAHANCYESFPLVGGVLLLALATGSTTTTNSLALVVLACRIGQSVVHLASVSNLAVNLRFALFAAQIGIAAYWLLQLYTKFAG
jgi:uncharacterized MAPEG superfamily protein